MSEQLRITRRDFLNGVALGMAAGVTLSPRELLAMAGDERPPYPPALTGMRGNHPGSFEIAHGLSRYGATWPRPDRLTDDTYDLVVVGGGISGLAAALFYRQRAGAQAKVLVLDNHDDFGGHAKRNEFDVGGKRLIGYGGSQSIDTPGRYSKAARQLLRDVSIDTGRFYDYFDQEYYGRRGLGRAIYFSAEAYGADSVHPNVTWDFRGAELQNVAESVSAYPLTEETRRSLERLLTEDIDYLEGLNRAQRIDALRAMSYTDFLERHAGVTREAATLFRDMTRGYWGVGWDALSALEAHRLGMPGTASLGIGKLENEAPVRDEPYIFHFPDGNAGVARALVRQLIPQAVPGSSMEDLVLARVDYGLLDRPANGTRIRLNSTAVNVGHADRDRHVDVTYVQNGEVCRVRGRHAILACYNEMVPHLCSEVPKAQQAAIAYATKVPLVYINIAVRNWKAFENLGYESFYVPQGLLMHSFGMDFPVSMGGYEFTRKSSEPTVIHGTYVPTDPGKGLTAREQHIAGRRQLYEQTFDEFERKIVRQLSGALEGGGFDAARDIAAITVNRWPHGYAYEYNEYSDPPEYGRYNGPHIAGRARIGRISIANSDASAYAYVDGAIDAADRAVDEQLGVA